MKNFLLSVLISGCAASPSAQVLDDSAKADSLVMVTDSIRLIFAGDVMGHGMQIKGAWRDGGDSCYNYFPVFTHIKEYISSADIAVANLEVTLAGEPYTGYPRFSTHQSLADALSDAGFDILMTANNHILDRGKQGLDRTVDVLDSIGMLYTGVFKDSTSRQIDYPLMVERNNFRLAFLNYTYGTNGISVERPNVVNYIDTIQMAVDLAKAHHLQADYIVTVLHWGEEYKNKENETQRRLAAFLARNGCNLIVGMHPHVVQPFEMMSGCNGDSVPVIYSLGNFISNQRDRYRDGGITFEVCLTKTNDTASLKSYGYEPYWVYRFPLNKVSVFRLIPINNFLRQPEQYPIGEENKKKMMQFYDDTKALLPGLPYGNFYKARLVFAQ